MAASSGSTSSVDSVKYTDLEPNGTFILHMFRRDNDHLKEGEILVETDADITLFLSKQEVTSRKIDPRKYHWHFVHRGSYFHLRSAFSGKMLQADDYCMEFCENGAAAWRLVTADDREDEGAFCVLKETPTHSILYHISESSLFPVWFGEDHDWRISHAKYFSRIQKDDILQWKFERVKSAMIGDVEIKYGPKDYGLPEKCVI